MADSTLNRYVVVAENTAQAFACVLILHAEDEQDCRSLVAQWFLRTDHGIPTSCTLVPLSSIVTSFNIWSNDEDVADFLLLD